MGYVFAALSLSAGAVKGYCGKKTSGAILSRSDSMIMNCLRMGLCVLIGVFLLLIRGDVRFLIPDAELLWVALLSGVSSAAFVVSWLLSVKSGAYMMVEVFVLIGAVVPIALCRVFFEEQVTPWQIVAILILLVAVYMMCTYNVSLNGKMKLSALVLLVLCGVSAGLSDFSQKLFVSVRPEGNVAAFNLYTYLFAGAVLLLAYLLFRRADQRRACPVRAPRAVIGPIWLYVLVMAVCLFANSFFKTEAAKYLDAALLYPLSQGAAVVISLFLSSVFFGERINRKCIVGIVLAVIALLLLNL